MRSWQVYIIHWRNEFRASKIMQRRALEHPKIEVLWETQVERAIGTDKGMLNGLRLQHTATGEVKDLQVQTMSIASVLMLPCKLALLQVHIDMVT